MTIMRASSGASEMLQHAVELMNRDLDGVLTNLSTKEQNEFWTNLQQYSLAEMRHEGRNADLIAAEEITDSVRDALEMIDARLAQHLESASPAETDQFWHILHGVTETQAEKTKQTKARYGGGN